jgi:hypothetical protein
MTSPPILKNYPSRRIQVNPVKAGGLPDCRRDFRSPGSLQALRKKSMLCDKSVPIAPPPLIGWNQNRFPKQKAAAIN